MRRATLAATLLLLLAGCSSSAMRPTTGFLDRRTAVGSASFPYVVYVPQSWTPDKRWPVILFLHGAGERGGDGLRPTQGGIANAIRLAPDRFPAIVVFPQTPDDDRWLGAPADAAMNALAAAMAEFHGDPDRVYLTGLSLGGYGTWHLALAHPGTFAALVPICGGIVPAGKTTTTRQSPLTEHAVDPYAFTAESLKRIPIWIFHGADDPIVLPRESRRMYDALLKEGADVRYTELPGVEHNAWDPAYGDPKLWQWLFAQHRPARPK